MNHERALMLHCLRIGNCQLKNMLISKIERIQKNMSKLIEKMMELEREQNKEVESFLRVSSLQILLKRKRERINVPYLQKTQGTKENNAARYSQENDGIKESTHKEPLGLRSYTRRNQPSVKAFSSVHS